MREREEANWRAANISEQKKRKEKESACRKSSRHARGRGASGNNKQE